MKITKKRLKTIILEEIQAQQTENRQIQAEIQVKIPPAEAHLGHIEGNCGDHACTTCAIDEPEVIDLSDFEPIYEEET